MASMFDDVVSSGSVVAADLSPKVESRPSKGRVLVVEDDAVLRRALVQILRMEGYRVYEAADGLAALSQAASHEVDLVMTDLCLPQLDGGELLRQLERLYPQLPVVVHSGECDAWERFGLNERRNLRKFLLKPASRTEVLQTLGQSMPARSESTERPAQ